LPISGAKVRLDKLPGDHVINTSDGKECGVRAGAESLMNELANTHDGRQSRHRNERGYKQFLLE